MEPFLVLALGLVSLAGQLHNYGIDVKKNDQNPHIRDIRVRRHVESRPYTLKNKDYTVQANFEDDLQNKVYTKRPYIKPKLYNLDEKLVKIQPYSLKDKNVVKLHPDFESLEEEDNEKLNLESQLYNQDHKGTEMQKETGLNAIENTDHRKPEVPEEITVKTLKGEKIIRKRSVSKVTKDRSINAHHGSFYNSFVSSNNGFGSSNNEKEIETQPMSIENMDYTKLQMPEETLKFVLKGKNIRKRFVPSKYLKTEYISHDRDTYYGSSNDDYGSSNNVNEVKTQPKTIKHTNRTKRQMPDKTNLKPAFEQNNNIRKRYISKQQLEFEYQHAKNTHHGSSNNEHGSSNVEYVSTRKQSNTDPLYTDSDSHKRNHHKTPKYKLDHGKNLQKTLLFSGAVKQSVEAIGEHINSNRNKRSYYDNQQQRTGSSQSNTIHNSYGTKYNNAYGDTTKSYYGYETTRYGGVNTVTEVYNGVHGNNNGYHGNYNGYSGNTQNYNGINGFHNGKITTTTPKIKTAQVIINFRCPQFMKNISLFGKKICMPDDGVEDETESDEYM